jgi:uncharacterized protein (TIGR03437 family)
MRLLVLLAALAGTLSAQGPNIIQIGSPLRWGGANSPDTYSDLVTFGPQVKLVDSGRVRIWQEQVPTGTNGEWDIFHMQIVNGGPLANNSSAEWNVVMDYTTRVASNFDAAADQFKINGVPVASISNFGSMCCASLTNPILPGPSYYRSGFNGPIPVGLNANWQQIFIRPYSFAQSGGVPIGTANEYSFALHFTLRPAAAPTITSVISAGAFGAFNTFSSGSWIEIYGTNFAAGTQQWTSGDFIGGVAPTTLSGLKVTIGGRDAFVWYVSPTQINVQVPNGVGPGPQNLVVTNHAGTSPPFAVNVASQQPGLLAPSNFTVNGNQHIVAFFADGAYVLPPGAIAGLTSRRARPGDTIILYGIGFGATTPPVAPGQIAAAAAALAAPISITFGGTPALVSYQGLAPNFVGLYQFNIVVPQIAANDAVSLSFSQAGAPLPQNNLRIAVGN